MTRYFSKSTAGFYVKEIHGAGVPSDAVEISDAEYDAVMSAQAAGKRIVADANGKPIAAEQPAPTIDQQRAALSRAVQAHLDATAKASGYDGIAEAVSYADEPAVPKYQAEGRAFRAWRSQVWMVAEAMIDLPSDLPAAPALLAALPPYAAPAVTS
jgi:hypothetical protein